MVGTIADISERKTAEEQAASLQQQLRQAQKLEAIGTLAGGIAHDFNNILGAMIGFTDLVAEDLPADSVQGRNLQKVLQAGHRARDLIGQILAFSRQAKPERVALQPQTIVKEVVKLLRSTLPATITVKQSIDPACGLVDIDPSQFHQVLMNLCTNAFHAMEDRGGILGVVLRPAEIVPERLRRQAERSGEQYLELLVSDTGHGVSKALMDKIFDPFFTTKEENKGTGMGLSIVFGIVSEYGGAVTVESVEGIGSVFRVFLPFTQRPAQEAEPATTSLSGGDEHIMLVDDEALLLEMTGKVLQRLGYTVTRIGDGREALELFRADPQRYDLVITDQTMPGLTGMDLAAKLLALRPDLPILLCTGYSAGISEEKVVQAGLKGLLYKPLLRKDLSRTIRRALPGRTFRATIPGEA
jgi:nitrogen-specific signal transduction histidine kinase/ActR/RegA family two-component response regulator